MVIFVIAESQFGSKLETVKRQGVEIMVCLDVSNSMLAEDVSPNRLDKAKQMLSKLTDGFKDDKMGLIVLPVTLSPSCRSLPIIFRQRCSCHPSTRRWCRHKGTAIGSAINLAMRSFTPSETSDKTIILITDGENHEGDAVKPLPLLPKRHSCEYCRHG